MVSSFFIEKQTEKLAFLIPDINSLEFDKVYAGLTPHIIIPLTLPEFKSLTSSKTSLSFPFLINDNSSFINERLFNKSLIS